MIVSFIRSGLEMEHGHGTSVVHGCRYRSIVRKITFARILKIRWKELSHFSSVVPLIWNVQQNLNLRVNLELHELQKV